MNEENKVLTSQDVLKIIEGLSKLDNYSEIQTGVVCLKILDLFAEQQYYKRSEEERNYMIMSCLAET